MRLLQVCHSSAWEIDGAAGTGSAAVDRGGLALARGPQARRAGSMKALHDIRSACLRLLPTETNENVRGYRNREERGGQVETEAWMNGERHRKTHTLQARKCQAPSKQPVDWA